MHILHCFFIMPTDVFKTDFGEDALCGELGKQTSQKCNQNALISTIKKVEKKKRKSIQFVSSDYFLHFMLYFSLFFL